MAVNFGLLQAAQPVSSFFQGQQDVRQQADQNMLRQQAQEERAFQLQQRQAQAGREAKFEQMAQLISQSGMDPDDPKVLSQFAQAALQSRNPALVGFAQQMAERAAKRRAAKEEAARIGAILSPAPVQQPAAQGINALTAPPVNALVAPQQELLAGTPFAIGPTAAPAAPARPTAPDNTARIAQYEQQRDALEAIGTPAALTQAKRLDRLVAELKPKESTKATLADRYKPVGRLVFDTEMGQYIEPPAAAIAATQDRGAGPAPAPKPATAPAPKPPTAAQTAKTEAQAQARVALSKDLKTVLGYYDKLNKMGAMPSFEKPGSENVIASTRSTGLGQEIERFGATKAQTERDNISNSRQRLLSHIKNATGASAQQMNSNVELQVWLNALTNPRQSIETVRETLGQLDSVMASVQSQVDNDTPAKPAAGAPAPSGANIETERANAQAAIAAGAPEAAVRERFRKNTGQEL